MWFTSGFTSMCEMDFVNRNVRFVVSSSRSDETDPVIVRVANFCMGILPVPSFLGTFLFPYGENLAVHAFTEYLRENYVRIQKISWTIGRWKQTIKNMQIKCY